MAIDTCASRYGSPSPATRFRVPASSASAVQHLALEQVEVGQQRGIGGGKRARGRQQRGSRVDLALGDLHPRPELQLSSANGAELGAIGDSVLENRCGRGHITAAHLGIGDQQAQTPRPQLVSSLTGSRRCVTGGRERLVDAAAPQLLLGSGVRAIQGCRRRPARNCEDERQRRRRRRNEPCSHVRYSGQDPLVSTSLTEPDPPVGDPSSMRIITSRRVLAWMISSPK